MRIETLLDSLEAMEAEVRTPQEWGATAQAGTTEIACERPRAAVTVILWPDRLGAIASSQEDLSGLSPER